MNTLNSLSRYLVSLMLTLLLASQVLARDASDRPNIVLILADDLGYGDLGCYGHPEAKTPNIDRLAKEGMRFTQHYANGPECSPTRTALLTGRYQQRVKGLECAIGTGNVGRYEEAIRLAEQRNLGLSAESAVLPKAIQKSGYTCGVFGKWHLGYEPEFNPIVHGWNSFFGYLGGNVHYFNHRETSDLHVLFQGRLPVHRGGYMTHLITDESISFIEQNRGRPFFLCVSHECPHFPFQGPEDQEKVVTAENWTERDAKTYVAMLEDLDSEVGRLLKSVDAAGIADNTLVIFVSDNGGYAGAAHMGPLRGAKSTTLEGGIRVPLIIRWPKQIEAGTTSTQVCATFDLTRSMAELAGTQVQGLDGYDIVKHVMKRQRDVRRTLFWRGRRGERIWRAVRDGDMKYVQKNEGSNSEAWMFNLASDVGKTNDLFSKNPAEAKRLRGLLKVWEAAVDRSRR